jgi:hypothetical protein
MNQHPTVSVLLIAAIKIDILHSTMRKNQFGLMNSRSQPHQKKDHFHKYSSAAGVTTPRAYYSCQTAVVMTCRII